MDAQLSQHKVEGFSNSADSLWRGCLGGLAYQFSERARQRHQRAGHGISLGCGSVEDPGQTPGRRSLLLFLLQVVLKKLANLLITKRTLTLCRPLGLYLLLEGRTPGRTA